MLTETWDNPYKYGGSLRRKLMPRLDDGPLHQARMNLALAGKIVEFAWKQGWLVNGAVVASPMMGEGSELLMAGLTGTAMPLSGVAPLTLLGIEVAPLTLLGIEVSPLYAARAGQYFALHGLTAQVVVQDARAEWPVDWPKFDLALFSPTYEGALTRWCEGPYVDSIRYGNDPTRPNPRPKLGADHGYAEAPGQVGTLRGNSWRAAMQDIYRRCAENAQPLGRMILVTKNRRHRNKLVDIASMSIEDASVAGWTQVAHIKATGAAQSLWAKFNNAEHYAKKGRTDLVIEHEDITVFRLTE